MVLKDFASLGMNTPPPPEDFIRRNGGTWPDLSPLAPYSPSTTYYEASTYRMDFSRILTQHAQSGADVTVATIPVTRGAASSLGILQVDQRLQQRVD